MFDQFKLLVLEFIKIIIIDNTCQFFFRKNSILDISIFITYFYHVYTNTTYIYSKYKFLVSTRHPSIDCEYIHVLKMFLNILIVYTWYPLDYTCKYTNVFKICNVLPKKYYSSIWMCFYSLKYVNSVVLES